MDMYDKMMHGETGEARDMPQQQILVGFTGTQHGMTDRQKDAVKMLLEEMKPTELHHGDCIGADSEVHDIAVALGIYVVIHPPTVETKRAFKSIPEGRGMKRYAKPYRDRNFDIVRECQVLIACPKEYMETNRSGTWMTIRLGRRMGMRIIRVSPFGSLIKEGF